MLEIIAASIATISVPNAEYDDAVFVQTELGRVRELRNASAAVISELWIGPSGQVLDCKVVAHSGSQEVADRVCALMKKRRLSAPQGPSDRPVYATTRVTTAWASNQRASERLARELASRSGPDRTLPSGPQVQPMNRDVLLALAISDQGRVVDCQFANSEVPGDWCGYTKNEQFAVMRDEGGQPVEYVRTYRLRLSPSG